MDVLSGIFIILLILAILTLVGFFITFLVGYIGKFKTTKKVGLIGSCVSGGAAVLFALMAFCAGMVDTHNQAQEQARQEEKQKEQEKKFKEASKRFNSLYYEVGTNSEDVAKAIADKWKDGINEADDADDFDVDSVIDDATTDEADDIEKIQSYNDDLKKQYSLIEKYSPNKETLKKYESAYNDLQDFVDLATSPSGSYNSYLDDYNELDHKTAKHMKELAE